MVASGHHRNGWTSPAELSDHTPEPSRCRASPGTIPFAMDFRRLGRTGLKVSRIGLGGGNFGGIGSDPRFFGQGEDEAAAFALMDRAWECGINFYDTADAYGGGRSESMIGRWLATKDNTVREQLLVSSKVFNPVGDGPNDRGLSRRHIKRQVEASLRRLGT